MYILTLQLLIRMYKEKINRFSTQKKLSETKNRKKIKEKEISRAWFRSTDLWVMGPARFHCATLLLDNDTLFLINLLNTSRCRKKGMENNNIFRI